MKLKDKFVEEWKKGLGVVIIFIILNALNILYYLYKEGRF